MGAEPDEVQVFVVGFSVDEDQVGPDMAIAVVAPVAGKPVVVIPARQGRIGRNEVYYLHEDGIEGLAVSPQLFPAVVAPEAFRVSNLPHSGWPGDCRETLPR